MPERTVEDRLREEYFDLLPEIRRVTEHLEAEIKYRLLPVSRGLDSFERIAVRSRIKECESAVESLRSRQQFATFDPDKTYTLAGLKDLAGVRVLAFPRSRVHQIDVALRAVKLFEDWMLDPVIADEVGMLAFKYSGYCDPESKRILAEYQIVSVLTGLFWEVEHPAIYKPSIRLRGVARSLEMQEPSQEVLRALTGFEEEFERLLREEPLHKS